MYQENDPSTNGLNGRDERGRFAQGNPGGPGNPHGRRVSQLRSRLLSCVSEHDFEEVFLELMRQAKAGEPWAVKEFFDRLLGRPQNALVIQSALNDFKNQLGNKIVDLLLKNISDPVILTNLSDGLKNIFNEE